MKLIEFVMKIRNEFYFNSEPSIRGVLLSLTPIAGSAGNFLVQLLGSFLSWRQVSLITAALPIIIVIAICFVSPFDRLKAKKS